MTDTTPSLSTPGGTNQNGENQGKEPTKAGRQRFKPQLSCTFCRNRKLKCDRNLPCENCVKRNQSSSCTYVHAASREKASQISKSSSGGAGSKDVQTQIRHLEEMVITLMNKTSKTKPSSSIPKNDRVTPKGSPDDSLHASDDRIEGIALDGPSLGDTAESFGRISMEDDQANYVGSAHWAAILDNIACLRDQLGASNPPQEAKGLSQDPVSPDLLVGSVKAATRPEILAAIPARSVVDAIIGNFFDTPDMGSTLIHVPTFRKEYEQFWAYPQDTPIMWIGLLFSIMCMSTGFQVMSGQSASSTLSEAALRDPVDAVNVFRERTVQCLVLDNYTEPGPYTVETMFLYYVSEHFRTADAQFGAWMVFGLMVRAAMRLGYHRDASHYSKVSVFRGEMQRRIWVSILHMDLITSLQVGLPRMIREGMYDTQSPKNLLDADFGEDTKVLPPSRQYSEFTPIGYSNSKHRITKVFGMIVDQANSTYPISYQEVMNLDKQLHESYQRTAEPIKIQSIEDLFTGTPTTRLRKFSVDITFQKARCVLHRKFFVTSKTTNTYPYPYSTKSCVEASMRILQSQILMHRETSVGHPLDGHKWKTSSLLTHDFLLAAMLICLYIGHSIGVSPPNQRLSQTGINIKWTQQEMVDALQGSYLIWDELSSTSKEALKAAKALKSMLAKVKGQEAVPAPSKITQPVIPTAQEGRRDTIQSISNREFEPSEATPAISNTDDLASPWLITYDQPSIPNSFQPYDDDQVMSTDALDWEVWDNHFTGNNNPSDTPPDLLWSFDSNFAFPDQNQNLMQWNQQF